MNGSYSTHNALAYVQAKLKAPKARKNEFGGYQYRSAEDILQASKPLLEEVNATLLLSDDIVEIGGRIYIKATAEFRTQGATRTVTAFAREPETKKGMDLAQITGSTSSYARKYALNGLFLIDDEEDADETNDHGLSATYVAKLHMIKDTYAPAAIRQAMKDYNISKLSEVPENEFQNFKHLVAGLTETEKERAL